MYNRYLAAAEQAARSLPNRLTPPLPVSAAH